MTDSDFPNLVFERDLAKSGDYRYLIGFDEVGRGALAGPVYVAAVLIDMDCISELSIPEGLKDSKLIKEKDRLCVSLNTQTTFPIYGCASSAAPVIDSRGITYALNSAAMEAFAELREKASQSQVPVQPDNTALLLDGTHDWLSETLPEWDVYTRVKGDKECISMAAASIIAKVARDSLMVELSNQPSYSMFAWGSNKGYGSKAHQEAISEYGPSEYHRHSWITKFL